MLFKEITITDGDIKKVVADIDYRKFKNQTNFNSYITSAREDLQGLIRLQLIKDGVKEIDIESKIDLVKDLPSKNLKKWILYTVIADIYMVNKKYDEMEVWRMKADKTAILFYIDDNKDGIATSDEVRQIKRLVFGR